MYVTQMTVPSISSMYGVVLGYLARDAEEEFDMWTEKIALTPIIFTAFWSIAGEAHRSYLNISSLTIVLY